MSVELIRKYNISPSGLGHARPTFDPISTKKKFEIRSDYSNGGGEEEGNLKIFGQRADPFRFNFPFLDRSYRDCVQFVPIYTKTKKKIRMEHDDHDS